MNSACSGCRSLTAKAVGADDLGRDADVLRHAAGVELSCAFHVAQWTDAARGTVGARQARGVMMHEDQVAGPDVRDGAADLDGPADGLVAQDGADLLRQVPRHQVAGADAAGERAEQ